MLRKHSLHTLITQNLAAGRVSEVVKVKVKLSLCFFFNRWPRHEGVLGERRYSPTHYLTSALDGDEWSVSRHGRFTSRERAAGCTHWIGGWVSPRAVLDAVFVSEDFNVHVKIINRHRLLTVTVTASLMKHVKQMKRLMFSSIARRNDN
jgi:hypothetical protein